MDITGRRFDRMSVARKSMIQLRTRSSNGNKLVAGPSSSGSPNEEDEIEVLIDGEDAVVVTASGAETIVVIDEVTGEEVQTVRRRSRTRKPRGRRRNTLAGTDQREIEEAAANGFVFTSVCMAFVTLFLSNSIITKGGGGEEAEDEDVSELPIIRVSLCLFSLMLPESGSGFGIAHDDDLLGTN